MPNSPGGQRCPALSVTSLPAPPSPVRYMSVWSQAFVSGSYTPLIDFYVWKKKGLDFKELLQQLVYYQQHNLK